jgi:hypothetical protein
MAYKALIQQIRMQHTRLYCIAYGGHKRRNTASSHACVESAFYVVLLLLLLQWDNFMHQMEPLVSAVPYMTTHGNHERDWPNSGDRFTTAYDSGGRISDEGLATRASGSTMFCLATAWHSFTVEQQMQQLQMLATYLSNTPFLFLVCGCLSAIDMAVGLWAIVASCLGAAWPYPRSTTASLYTLGCLRYCHNDFSYHVVLPAARARGDCGIPLEGHAPGWPCWYTR